MIQELKNYIDYLETENEDVFSLNLQLRDGIYVLLDIKQDEERGNLILNNEDQIFESQGDYLFNEGKEDKTSTPLYEKFLKLTTHSKVVGSGKNKSFNSSSGIFMFTATPFGIALKKERVIKDDKTNQSIRDYFKAAIKFAINQEQIDLTEKFRSYCEKHLVEFVKSLPDYENLKKSDFIYLFLKGPTLQEYKEVHQAYLKNKVFNKDKFNIEVDEQIYGVSDSLSGFNDKKMFLKHFSAPLEYNYRITGKEAMQIWRFFQLQSNKQIPNPIPVFVDQQELNDKVISIFHKEDRKIGHADMVRRLIEDADKKDLHDYYLIFFQGTKGSRIADIDFIPVFHYELNEKIEEIFPLGGKVAKNIKNVFELEWEVFNRALNGQLRTEFWLKYFGEIKYDPKYLTDTTYNQLLKYRKAIYDFIYKSRRQAFTSAMFDELMIKGIIDDLRHDEKKNDKNTHEYFIKEKLNIWFSLYTFFTNTESKNRHNMVNKTKELLEYLSRISKPDSEEHITDDAAFAFASGQVIWKLLVQSRSSNRSHALLEPFLQKVDVGQFKLAIARTFEMYKHEFTLYPTKYEFDKIMSEVMGYEPNEPNMKNLLHYILAGYFARSIFTKKENK